MIVWYISLLIAGALAGAPETSSEHSTQDRTENIRVTCFADFDIFVAHEEKFCNGTELISGNLIDGVYFQYRTNVTGPWITVDVYNATRSIMEQPLVFQSNDTQLLWVQFRWIQYDTIGSPVWAIDDIRIYCTEFKVFKDISFEEKPNDFNKELTCHSGFRQEEAQECTDTQYSLLLNGTNRELRMPTLNLLNDSISKDDISQEGEGIPNNCQPQNCLGPSLSHGFIWSTTQVNETARMQCSEISTVFWPGLYATRECLSGGVWDEVDMSQCTIKNSDGMPFIVYSLYLEMPEHINNSFLALNQSQQSFDVWNTSVTVNLELHTKVNHYSVTLMIFTVTFNNITSIRGNSTMMEVAKLLATVKLNYSPMNFFGFPEVVIMYPVDTCQCKNSFIFEEEQQRIIVVNVCVGISVPPCTANDSGSGSKCNEPYYTGNITHCAITNMRNETQYDCSEGFDMEFGISWKGTRKNSTVSQHCPNGTGNTSRVCDSSGNWQVPDVQMCNSSAYHKLFEQICNITELTFDINELNSFLMDFVELIDQTNFSIFPLDLKTVNNIMEKFLIAIEENSTLWTLEEVNIAEGVLNIYDSIFDSRNEPGFKQLIEIDRTENQNLIIQSEKFGMLLAANTNAENNELYETHFPRENFVISVQRSSVRDISFKVQLNQFNQTSIHIPSQLLEQKPKDANGLIPIVNIVYKTLHRFLPITIDLNGQRKEPVSLVISSQVGNTSASSLLPRSNPVTLKFDHDAPSNVSNVTRCAFWNFNLDQTGGDGGWDSTNLVIAEESQDGHITCHSLHLTCFAVLVDVSSTSQKQEIGLTIVTYIGCGISVICLLIAIIFLMMFRNTILKGVNNFAHLNLSIALFLALIVFLAGIETATNNQIACTVVAALLHYLFTAVFSWMLCEGILLYFLIVKVFSFKFTKRRWPYFIFGWGIPIPIVATAVGIAHHHYGNEKFCWISIKDGAIWAFVGPMLLIVLMNIIVLIMVLQVLFKSKAQSMTADEAKQVNIVKSLIKATVVLLPLLGVSWVFGLLAVNENLIVFAWIFTVLNSLQGLLILLFHVLRNKKVREKVRSTVVVYTSSLKIHGTSTLNSPPPIQGKSAARTSVKINIEHCEGDTMNGIKVGYDSNCYASTIKTSCSEGRSSTGQISLSNWKQTSDFLH